MSQDEEEISRKSMVVPTASFHVSLKTSAGLHEFLPVPQFGQQQPADLQALEQLFTTCVKLFGVMMIVHHILCQPHARSTSMLGCFTASFHVLSSRSSNVTGVSDCTHDFGKTHITARPLSVADTACESNSKGNRQVVEAQAGVHEAGTERCAGTFFLEV